MSTYTGCSYNYGPSYTHVYSINPVESVRYTPYQPCNKLVKTTSQVIDELDKISDVLRDNTTISPVKQFELQQQLKEIKDLLPMFNEKKTNKLNNLYATKRKISKLTSDISLMQSKLESLKQSKIDKEKNLNNLKKDYKKIESKINELTGNISTKKLNDFKTWDKIDCVNWFKHLQFLNGVLYTLEFCALISWVIFNISSGKELLLINKLVLNGILRIKNEQFNEYIEKNVKSLSKEESNKKNSEYLLCSICNEKSGDRVIVPCGHKDICKDCCDRIKNMKNTNKNKCPFCKRKIEKSIKYYNTSE